MSKTLHMVRCLRSFADEDRNINMKIIVLESKSYRYCGTRFSRCVDNFHVITSPRDSPEAYKQGIYDACKLYNATHFLPVAAPVEAVYDAQLKDRLESELGMKSLHMNYELCEILDDKHLFCSFLRDTLNVRSLKTFQVTTNDAVREYNKKFQGEKEQGLLNRSIVLKNLAYDPIHRLDLFQLPTTDENLDAYLKKIEVDGNPITKGEPWQLQEFLSNGTEYAAMIVVRSNYLVTMTCCPSSASQLNYVHVEIPCIREWLEDFMAGLSGSKHTLTGQLCFDFMVVKENGVDVAYPIECNPRVHTQCSIYNRDDVRSIFGKLLLSHDPKTETELNMKLERDYGRDGEETPLNVYWFYNEFLQIFPNSWLLKYNDDSKPNMDIALCMPSSKELGMVLIYLPSVILWFVIAFPVFMSLLLVSCFGINTHRPRMRVITGKMLEFLKRLSELNDNIEGDMWINDIKPFLAKNHVQIPSRLLATIRTGVEWKKIDYAIGKVVEVGGD